MRKYIRTVIIVGVLVSLVLSAAVYEFSSSKRVWAANSSLSLSSTTQTITQGQNLSVTIKVNTGGDPINVVQANLNYPTAIFDTVSISNSSSFGIVAENVASGGIIKIARGTFTPVTGTADVATITLHASGSGSAALNFVSGTLVVRSTDNVNTLSTTSGSTYTVSAPTSPAPAPAPTPSPTPTPTPPPAPGPAPSPSPTPTPTPPPPTPTPSPTPQPAPSPAPTSNPTPPAVNVKKGDCNKDGVVNIFDLSILLSNYGGSNSQVDFNADHTVNIFDLSILLSNYGS